ncbi:MAG TPA: hypothetical protein VEY95_11415 [Azospirillaceae bacterium]|nr:hypothetical protein [Azospirillaceae bacterium]
MRRLAILGFCSAFGFLASLPTPGAAQPPREGVWASACKGEGAGRMCDHTVQQAYPNNRGSLNRMLIAVRQAPECTSLHITFDSDIDVMRPVSLSVDGGAQHLFYTGGELARFAKDLDDGQPVTWAPPAFQAYAAQVESGEIASDAAIPELVARFALVKEERRLGAACAAAERLLAELKAGNEMVLSFAAEPRSTGEIYHWPALDRRTVRVSLPGLRSALLGAPAAPVAAAGEQKTPVR